MKLKTLLVAGLILALMAGLLGSPGLAAAPAEKADVFIVFSRQPGSAEAAIVRGAGGDIRYTYWLVPAIAASVPKAAIDGLARNPRVTVIEPILDVYALDTELDNTWGVKRIGAGVVHDANDAGSGVKVAVIDTGIDYSHTELADNYAGGYDFVNDDSNPMDDNGHGTHVAGTIAAADNDTGVVGVAPEASVYALKVLGANGSGSFDDVIAALQWAVANGIQITNNSYGSSGDPGTAVKAAFDNAYAAGVLHIASAGNSGNRRGVGDNVGYPAKYDSVIAVAASDANDQRASFSSTGPAVELIAPGVSIKSTYPGNLYAIASGTSMASPHVAGTTALVLAANAGLTNVQVRSILQSTAEDLGLPAEHQGYGLVRADLAVDEAPGGEPPSPQQYNLTISSGTGGTVATPGEGTFTYDEGTVVGMVATPDAGYRFANWTGQVGTVADVNAASTTITMNGDYSITANFEEAQMGLAPEVTAVIPSSASPKARIMVTVSGANFQDGATADFGEGVAVQSVTFVSATELGVQIRVHNLAVAGTRDVTVTNPDGQSGTLAAGFTVV